MTIGKIRAKHTLNPLKGFEKQEENTNPFNADGLSPNRSGYFSPQ
jgi:hypothetical protein